MIRVRLLGFERETVRDDWVIPKPIFSLKLPMVPKLTFCSSDCCADIPIEIGYQEFELERVLSVDDGGPLAIYGRVR